MENRHSVGRSGVPGGFAIEQHEDVDSCWPHFRKERGQAPCKVEGLLSLRLLPNPVLWERKTRERGFNLGSRGSSIRRGGGRLGHVAADPTWEGGGGTRRTSDGIYVCRGARLRASRTSIFYETHERAVDRLAKPCHSATVREGRLARPPARDDPPPARGKFREKVWER